MWQNNENNYPMPQEEDPFDSSQPTMSALPNPVPESEDELPSSTSPDMALMLLSITYESYSSSQATENSMHLQCDCTENMSIRDQEYVISSNLIPRRPFSPLASNVPYYPPSRHGNSTPEAGSSRQNIYVDEEALHLNIATSSSIVPAQEDSEPVNDAPERVSSYPVPYTLRVRCAASMPQPSSAAVQVANRVINYARAIRNAREEDISCLDCGYYPFCPVTGMCGHTRCARCIQANGKCSCGNDPPESLFVNVLIQDLINKAETSSYSAVTPASCNLAINEHPSAPTATTIVINKRLERVSEPRRGHGVIRRTRAARPLLSTPYFNCSRRIPISLQARYNHALELVAAQRYLEAAPHLALAAGSRQPETRSARMLLAQVITLLCKDKDPRRFNRRLNRSVRQILSTSWIKVADMECILCSDTFTNPVTTPCGHMFCRTCIERALDYHKRCPLCLRSLQAFNVNATRETVFVEAALAAIHALNVPGPLEPDFIPIFVCTVAYPSVPCPLFIFDPRYWLMIRRVLESGSRKFGMLYGDRDCRHANIGTLLEVQDCVHFEDGRSILSTVGVSRFRVIERSVRDGCEVARIRTIRDALPTHLRDILGLKMMGNKIMLKAVTWLVQINPQMWDDIETTFGGLPRDHLEEDWWESADGPAWLWWLVAVLPLQSQIKVLILATDCLIKRMMAVMHTLNTLVGVQDPPSPVGARPRA